ncbi:NUDIX hydrolase [bacterium]|nr:NUDIX hydrolase [bacterium]|tara:strand:- start:527 stop:964 length:438 start_codon:yes stop_codon:yes gene_type:complete
MSARFTYIGSAYLFLVKDGKILLQRRFQTGFEDGKYGVPSGHMDGDETAREACAREIKEEVGVDVSPEDLEIVHVMHRKASQDERIDFFMTTDRFSGEIKNVEPHKCDDLNWFSLDDLPENMVHYVRVAIDNYNSGVTYSEYGWR